MDKAVDNYYLLCTIKLYARKDFFMDRKEMPQIWESILERSQETLSESICKNWLRPVVPISLENQTLTLGAPTSLHKDWIEKRYITILEDAAQNEMQQEIHIVLKSLNLQTVNESSADSAVSSPDLVQGTLLSDASAPAEKEEQNHRDSSEQIAPGDTTSLNPKYTFNTFVMGKSNQLAHGAAMGVAAAPGTKYNPLFMYGGVGLGKTHLMHAIGNQILKSSPQKRVLYVSCEQFTNELINSIRDNKGEFFRQKYRTIDVLLVDDIQFLSGKQSTQEEFFHTFNELYNANKQIILSSDRPPKDVDQLTDRLRSRFECGLITDIQAPDLETRIAILKKKALLDNINVGDEVMIYIASRIDSNIRELEGALTRVVAYASLTHQMITTELVAEALKDIFANSKPKEITMDVIQKIVADYFAIPVDDLHSKKRPKNIAYPRQIAMYLCRELTDTSLPQIGSSFGGRDHTTVMHACDKIKTDKEQDKKLQKALKDLTALIQQM